MHFAQIHQGPSPNDWVADGGGQCQHLLKHNDGFLVAAQVGQGDAEVVERHRLSVLIAQFVAQAEAFLMATDCLFVVAKVVIQQAQVGQCRSHARPVLRLGA